MKKGVVLLLIIFSLQIVCAQTITVDYPPSVVVGEEFPFTISLSGFEEGVYDVKVDIIGDGQRIAKIFEHEDWKSTYYYVNEVVSSGETVELSLIVNTYTGPASIIIKVRNSVENIETFEGYEIRIVSNLEENVSESQQDPLPEPEPEEELPLQETSSEPLEQKLIFNELISLNPQVIKSEDETEMLDKSNYATYGFLIFCILLVLLLLIQQKRKKLQ